MRVVISMVPKLDQITPSAPWNLLHHLKGHTQREFCLKHQWNNIKISKTFFAPEFLRESVYCGQSPSSPGTEYLEAMTTCAAKNMREVRHCLETLSRVWLS